MEDINPIQNSINQGQALVDAGITKTQLEKVFDEVYKDFPNPIQDLGNGLYKIVLGDRTIHTNRAGVEMFNKAVEDCFKETK